MPDEKINHPSHYGGDGIYETIKVIEAWKLNYTLGNAVKYISRAGKKPGASYLEDLKKAEWYIQHEIAKADALDSRRRDSSSLTDGEYKTHINGDRHNPEADKKLRY